MTTKLHYVHDPLCGWCYAAAPLVAAAQQFMTVVPHGGGMLSGPNRRKIAAGWREHVMPHDQRIAKLSGQPFGEAYFEKLLRDEDAMLDSDPPIAAIMVADRMAGSGLEMLSRVQTAHYVHGRRISERSTLVDIAKSLGLDEQVFGKLLDQTLIDGLQSHLAEAHRLLTIVGRRGYPTFILERDGDLQQVDSASYLGKSEPWVEHLRGLVSA
jgi:putative protein-disulfide isomerase